MNRTSKITTQKLTRLALLAAAAVVLGYIEGLITAFAPLPPGIKLGLANTVLLYAIYTLGPGYSVILMILKVVLTGFMSGDAQQIWDDAMASEEPWEPMAVEEESEIGRAHV